MPNITQINERFTNNKKCDRPCFILVHPYFFACLARCNHFVWALTSDLGFFLTGKVGCDDYKTSILPGCVGYLLSLKVRGFDSG